MPLFLKLSATNRGSSALLLAILVLLHGNAKADLGSYEQAATRHQVEKPAPAPGNTPHDATPAKDCNDPENAKDIDCDATGLLLAAGAVLMVPLLIASTSVARETGDHAFGMDRRHPHDRDIPYLAADINWHDVHADQDISGIEGRLEAGWGPLSVEASRMSYRQHDPENELDISRLHVLLRGTMQVAQMNFGVGTVRMHGREANSGTSLLVALSLFPSDTLSVDSRWTGSWINGSRSNEYDVALGWGLQGYAVRAGYRYNVAEDEGLHGPYAGLAWRY